MDILTDWAYRKNRWYDALPYQQQFLTAFWSTVLGIGLLLIIMLYTGIHFGAMLAGVVAIVMIPRSIYCFGYMQPSPWLPPAPEGPSKVEITAPDWVFSLNQWFDTKPSHERPIILAAATLALFAFNMLLNGVFNFPMALLFFVVVWVLAAFRVGWHYGWLVPKPGSLMVLAPPVPAAPSPEQG